jgi:C-terminal processing protease CtpA/Prc
MPAFDLDEGQVDRIISQARRRKVLVTDLRGNRGGSVKTLEWLAGSLFRRRGPGGGIQGPQGRGTVVGDRTAGAVMRGTTRAYQLGYETVIVYGLAITEADVIMADGKSLEHAGVTADVALSPSPENLAAQRDPVLSRALELAGSRLDPAEAGKLFPRERAGRGRAVQPRWRRSADQGKLR